jgi:NTE family protein
MSYKFGLVLSGGGTRGAFHIGVIKALQESSIKPDIIAGCSAGALVGAFYAAGYPAGEIFDFFKNTSLFSHPSFTPSHPGMFESTKYFNDLTPFFPRDDFNALGIELRTYSTDLLKGELVEHKSGKLIETIVASCAIPGFFTPIERDSRLLSDGGIIKVFPVSSIRDETQRILGVLITNPGIKKRSEINHTHQVLNRTLTLNIYSRALLEKELCDWIIDPPEIAPYSMISKKKIEDLYELGYSYGLKFIPELEF